MFSIIASHNKTSVGINTYLVDTIAERDVIRTKPGSKAYVIETGLTYILSHSGEWEEYYPALKRYVDEKFAGIDADLLQELKDLIDQIESGSIDEKIATEISIQLSTPETQVQLVNMIKQDPDIVTVDKLETYEYITQEDLQSVVLDGGTATSV